MLLAIDTSTETAGIALLRPDGKIQNELTWTAGRNHTTELYPALEHLLAQAKTTTKQITGLAAAIGPGSFTGIRVGMAAAKGLAVALDIPLAGVTTLEASAYPFSWHALPIWAVVDAGRGDVAAACFQRRRGAWGRVRKEAVMSAAELCAAVAKRRALVCGEIPPQIEERLRAELQDRVIIPEPGLRLRRAGYVGLLGWERLQRGDADDTTTLAPLYLRNPAVLDKR